MFGKFDGMYINFKAVSEIVLIEQSGVFRIQLFRYDGSFMASETYLKEDEAERAYQNLWDWLMNAGIASVNR